MRQFDDVMPGWSRGDVGAVDDLVECGDVAVERGAA
jgi:hypothetical protein